MAIPTLIFEGHDDEGHEIIGHLPPGTGQYMQREMKATRHALVELTDRELDYLMDLGLSNQNEYRELLQNILDKNDMTSFPS